MFNEYAKVLGIAVLTMYGIGLFLFFSLILETNSPIDLIFKQCLDFISIAVGVSLFCVSFVFLTLTLRTNLKR